MDRAMTRLSHCESFDASNGTGLSDLRITRARAVATRKPIAHVTNHGDLFCTACKLPERYDDGHEWLPVHDTVGRLDECDECGRVIGGVEA